MLTTLFGFALMASAITTNKILLGALSPALFVSVRMGIAGAVLFAYHILYKSKRSWRCYINDVPRFCAIALFTTMLPSLLKAYALSHLPSSYAALIGSIDPFVTALYAYALWDQRITARQLSGMLLGFISVTVVIALSQSQGCWSNWYSLCSIPSLAAILAVFLNRYGWITARNIMRHKNYSSGETTGLIMLFGSFFALCSAVIGSDLEINQPITLRLALTMLYTIIAGNIYGYNIYAHSIQRLPLTTVSLLGLSIPFFVHIFGVAFLGEQTSTIFIAALVLMTIGTAIFVTDPHTRTQKD